jgi:hypothetical protein
MAGSSGEEDENYWPGYVDALTTMTMVLTFVMMILGVMVFMLSQDITNSKVGVIARALKIQTEQAENLSDDQIEKALRSMVQEHARGEADAREGTSVRPDDPAKGKGSGGGDGINRPAEANNSAVFQSPFDGGLIGDKAAGPGGEYLVSTRAGTVGPVRGTGARPEQGTGALRFVFERGAIDLPPLGDEAIFAYVAAQGSGPVTIRAMAMAVDGGPSEARRRAYFRAMLVRTRFIKAGVRPQDIEIQVRDEAQASTQEVVDIFKKIGG